MIITRKRTFTKLFAALLLGPFSSMQALNLEPTMDKIGNFLSKDSSKTGLFVGACVFLCCKFYQKEQAKKALNLENLRQSANSLQEQWETKSVDQRQYNAKKDSIIAQATDLGLKDVIVPIFKYEPRVCKAELPEDFGKKIRFSWSDLFKF